MGVNLSQFDFLSRLIDTASLRHRVIAQNIANVNTPGYRRLEVSFDEEVGRAMGKQVPGAGSSSEPRVVEADSESERADGNNVGIDAEVGRLNKNTLLYNAYTQILASKIAAMRSAISGR
jgi:flagellar basal-body rod protein FlgB